MNQTESLYFKLAILIGVLCKVYDDIADNNLYAQVGISNEAKPYFNDTMQSMFMVGFAIISIEYPFFMILFMSSCALALFNCPDDFNSYDRSIFAAFILIVPFIKNWDQKHMYQNIGWAIALTILAELSDVGASFIWGSNINMEYSYTKLTMRAIILLLSIFIKLTFAFFPN